LRIDQLHAKFAPRREGPAMRVLSAEEVQANAREREREEQEKYAQIPALTPLQTVALLKMSGFKRPGSTLARGVAKHMENTLQAKPDWLDYRVLHGLGLCTKPPGEKWHQHTAKGAESATLIAKMKAKEFNLHIFVEADHVKASATFACTCGNWRGAFSRGPNGRKSAYGRWYQHVIDSTPAEPTETAAPVADTLTFDLAEQERELCDQSPVGQHQYGIADNYERCIHCNERSNL
jgi:hypothetical protein